MLCSSNGSSTPPTIFAWIPDSTAQSGWTCSALSNLRMVVASNSGTPANGLSGTVTGAGAGSCTAERDYTVTVTTTTGLDQEVAKEYDLIGDMTECTTTTCSTGPRTVGHVMMRTPLKIRDDIPGTNDLQGTHVVRVAGQGRQIQVMAGDLVGLADTNCTWVVPYPDHIVAQYTPNPSATAAQVLPAKTFRKSSVPTTTERRYAVYNTMTKITLAPL